MIYVKVPSYAFTENKHKALKKAMRQVGAMLVRDTKKVLRSAVASGRVYGQHKASAPGQIPAKESGKLLAGVTASVGKDGTYVAIKDKEHYSRFLEGGAKGGGGRQTGVTGRINPRTGKIKQRRQRGRGITSRILQPRPFISVVVAKDIDQVRTQIVKAFALDITFVQAGKL